MDSTLIQGRVRLVELGLYVTPQLSPGTWRWQLKKRVGSKIAAPAIDGLPCVDIPVAEAAGCKAARSR